MNREKKKNVILMTLNGPLKGIYSGDGEYKVDHT